MDILFGERLMESLGFSQAQINRTRSVTIRADVHEAPTVEVESYLMTDDGLPLLDVGGALQWIPETYRLVADCHCGH